MPTITLEANHRLRGQLHAESVDFANGIIRGATVAKAGVQATGKFYTGPDGTEYPVYTDEETLTTLLSAAKVAGKRVKVREDHLDEPGARAGYSFEFKPTDDGRVTTDIQLFKSYGNRALMLETAMETPEEIGLSIDFLPRFDVRDGKAFLRVVELNAVDIVDEGAITPDGLFLSARVDTTQKVETEKSTSSTMAAEPTSAELLSAITALAKTVGEMQLKLAATPATVAPAADPAIAAVLAATNELKEQFAAQKQEIVQMKREKALLGFRGTSEDRAKLATAQPEEIVKAVTEHKSYLKLVADRVASEKCSKTAAHEYVQKNHLSEYTAHLESKGVIRVVA